MNYKQDLKLFLSILSGVTLTLLLVLLILSFDKRIADTNIKINELVDKNTELRNENKLLRKEVKDLNYKFDTQLDLYDGYFDFYYDYFYDYFFNEDGNEEIESEI